ncbi:MAG: glycosyltransferase [Patescibacteria group bacterium]
MRIAIFTDSYYPMLNGVTVSIANLTKELRALGHTVYIFAPKFDNYQDTEKDVYRLKAFKVISSEPEVHMPIALPHQLVKEIQKHDFDIVHAHGNGFFSFLGYQVAKVKGVPFVLTFHTQLTEYMHYVFKGKIITPRMAATALRIWGNISDTVVTPSEKMKKELVSYRIKKPMVVVSNFIYPEKFQSEKKGFLHELCKIPKNSPILLSVGRLGKEKNFLFLLKAFQIVAQKDKLVHLVVVGGGEEANSIKNYADKLGLSQRVHFTGKIDQANIPLAYADAEIFVFASLTETQGIVILEAASSGLPFVVVKDGAYKHIIKTDVNGYQVPLNASAFAQKVLYLLDNATVRDKFGAASKRIISENFKPKKVAEDMVAVYTATLARRSRKRFTLRSLNKAALQRLYRNSEIFSRVFQ